MKKEERGMILEEKIMKIRWVGLINIIITEGEKLRSHVSAL